MAINRTYIVTFGISLLAGVVTLCYFLKRRNKESKSITSGKTSRIGSSANITESVTQSDKELKENETPLVEIPTSRQNDTREYLGTFEPIDRGSIGTFTSIINERTSLLDVSLGTDRSESSAINATPREKTSENGSSGHAPIDKDKSDSYSTFVECEVSLMNTFSGESNSLADSWSNKLQVNSHNSSSDKSPVNEVTVTKTENSMLGMTPTSVTEKDGETDTKSDSHQQTNNANEVSPMQVADTLMRLSKPGALSELSHRDAVVLNYTVSFVQGKERARILETIAGAASFSVNLPLLTSSGCLQSLQDFLRKIAMDRRSCSENEKIALLHALTNISCSDNNQQILKHSVDDLFALSEGQEESRVGLACLCVIANLSLTTHCHAEVSAYSTRIFELLEEEDTALLKQALIILLNLCAEASTVPRLLIAQAPTEIGKFVMGEGPIGKTTDLLIKWLKILRNLYKVIREDNITVDKLMRLCKGDLTGSVYNTLQDERLNMKPRVFVLCHNKESHGLATSAKMLHEYLETTN